MQPRKRRKIQDLQKVLAISRSMVAAEDLQSLLRLIIDRSMELLNAERASLFLYNSDRDELVSRIAAGVGEIRVPADKGISGATVMTGRTINVNDAYSDQRFNPEVDRRTGYRTQNILSVPLSDHTGRLVGVLQIINKRSGGFGDYDEMLAETLGAQAGVAIQRANLIDHFVQKQRMERSLEIAREIQQGLLPRGRADIRGFDVAGVCVPADETGGDIYDFLELPCGNWLFMVADATGHGVGPALIVVQTRAMLRAVSMCHDALPAVMQTANRLLVRDLEHTRFVTCFLGILSPGSSHLTYASAGHGPLLFYKRSRDEFTKVPATALPLGVDEQTAFETLEYFRFEPGDFAVITTDGVFEAENSGGEQFSIGRVMDTLRQSRDLPASEMINGLCAAVTDFAGSSVQGDDLTALVVRKE